MTEIREAYPYLRVHSAAEAIDFYTRAFGAKELFRLTEPSGRIGHAEMKMGASTLMLADASPERGLHGPRSLGGTTFSIHLHVENVDAAFAQAVAAGAAILTPLQDQFYGERSGTLRDPFGHEWLLGAHSEDVAPEEMQRRYTEMLKT